MILVNPLLVGLLIPNNDSMVNGLMMDANE
jgi:hypothetical protein